MQALIQAQNRITSGELKPVLGKNATPEQLKEWRDAHGVPETPEKYDVGKIEDASKPLYEKILAAAHTTNQTPEQVKANLAAFSEVTALANEARSANDLKVQQDGEETLRAEWGHDFRRNINLIHGMLDGSASPALKESLLGGRLADGTPIGSSPEALRFLVGLALIQNPTGIVVPGSEANPMQGIADEKAKIEKTMKENRGAYNKDTKMQERYRELIDAELKMKPKQAA